MKVNAMAGESSEQDNDFVKEEGSRTEEPRRKNPLGWLFALTLVVILALAGIAIEFYPSHRAWIIVAFNMLFWAAVAFFAIIRRNP
jgi:hypothetical protein